MNEAAAGRTRSAIGTWCGWVMIGGLALVPLLGWLGPMGFAVLVALMGLLSLPVLRLEDADRTAAAMLLMGLIWAAISSIWSPFHPHKAGNNTVFKLALQLPLYWAAVCGARYADPRLRQIALSVLAWGTTVFGLILLVEFVTDARLYEALHFRFYEPIRHDLAQSNIGHSSFVLALIWPLAMAAALKRGISPWVAAPMVLGVAAAALRFGSDAPVLSLALVGVVGLSTWLWPATAPRVLGGAAVVYILCAPLVVWAVRAGGDYGTIERAIPLSWSERMSYWSHAVDWIRDHPLRGWGLDASRMFGPGIILHPHDNALQYWLELGGLGALLVAGFWWAALSRLARPVRDPAVVAVASSASVYLLFGALNFGAWQEWWLALGGLLGLTGSLLLGPATMRTST